MDKESKRFYLKKIKRMEEKLDQILSKLEKLEKKIIHLENKSGVGRTIGLALLADVIAETIKNNKN